jgi:hypothetical protein
MPDENRKTEVEVWLRRLHVANGHLSGADMSQAVRDAGGSEALVRMAKRYVCPQCQIEQKVANRRHSNLPIRARHFNAVVVLDLGVVHLDRPGETQQKVLLLGMIDSWSMFSQVFLLQDGSTSAVTAAAQRGWLQPFGAPRRIFHDSAAAFRGADWGQCMELWSAAAQPRHRGSMELSRFSGAYSVELCGRAGGALAVRTRPWNLPL